MKQGILKKPLCDHYYQDKFRKSIRNCNEIVSMSTKLIKCLEEVLGCLKKTEESLDKTINIQEVFLTRTEEEGGIMSSPLLDFLHHQKWVLYSLHHVNRSLSTQILEDKFMEWKEKIKDIHKSHELSKRRTTIILQRKQESIKKLRFKIESGSEPELEKLLSSMIKDLESKTDVAAQEDKKYYEELFKHEQKFYVIIVDWLKPLKEQIETLKSKIKTRKGPTNGYKIGGEDEPEGAIHKRQSLLFEDEILERPQSPYSIILSPEKVCKITKRPPLPLPKSILKHTPQNGETVAIRNETKCYDTTETSGEFLKFSDLQECQASLPEKLPNEINGNTKEQNKTANLLPDSQLIPDQNSESCKSDNTIVRNANASTVPLRPKTPPLRSIVDQTAKAALIRTMITERLNSCSPVNF